MEKHRPFGVTLLAILALVAMLVAIVHALQMLGILPFMIGDLKFFTPEASWIAALMWGFLAILYLWVFTLLWNVNPQGWLFVVVVATLNLILDALSLLGASTFQALLPSLLINGIILIYCLLPPTRKAFGT